MDVNALKLRQNLGKYLDKMEKNGEPIIVERDSVPVAVLVSIQDYKSCFLEVRERERKKQILAELRADARKPKRPTLEVLRETRGYDPDR